MRKGKSEGGEEKGGEKESFFSAYPPMGSYWASMLKYLTSQSFVVMTQRHRAWTTSYSHRSAMKLVCN